MKVKKTLRKSKAEFHEKLIKSRIRQNNGFLVKKRVVGNVKSRLSIHILVIKHARRTKNPYKTLGALQKVRTLWRAVPKIVYENAQEL